MNGTYLRFYMHENVKHHHRLLYEWLLEHAQKIGLHGGSAFRAIAGFGRKREVVQKNREFAAGHVAIPSAC